MIGQWYFERGSRVLVLVRWGPGGGPRNVLVLREDGSRVVRPFRGLRKPRCSHCADSGHVCENHPATPWGGVVVGGCDCGPGMPCASCCAPVPGDGSTSITAAFTPRLAR